MSPPQDSLSQSSPNPDQPEGTTDSRQVILLAGITLLGGVLRLLYIGSKSLWQDEAVSVFIGRLSSAEFRHILWNHELNMSLYYWLLRFWLRLGSDEFTVRSLSALAGTATLPIIYFLAKRMLGNRAGWVAALLLAVHPSHVAYSQEARGYALVVFFCALSSLFFVHAVGLSGDAARQADSERKSSRKLIWVGYVAASVLAVYSHFFAVLVIAPQWLTLIFLRSSLNLNQRMTLRWRGWWRSALAIVALLSPAAWFVMTRNAGQLDWIPPITTKETLHLIFFLTGNSIRFILYLGLWMVAARQAIDFARGNEGKASHRSLFCAFVAIWLLFPVLFTIGVSLWKPVMAPRFLIVCLPAAVLLAAAGSAGLSQRWNAVWVTVLALASLNSVISYYRRPREDWRAAANYVLSNSKPGDALAILPEYGHFPFDYYEQRYLERTGAGARAAPPVLMRSSDLAKEAASFPYRRTWLVIYQPESTNPEKRSAIESFSKRSGETSRKVHLAKFTSIEVRLLERNSESERGAGAPERER
jgi:hypothetical protein